MQTECHHLICSGTIIFSFLIVVSSFKICLLSVPLLITFSFSLFNIMALQEANHCKVYNIKANQKDNIKSNQHIQHNIFIANFEYAFELVQKQLLVAKSDLLLLGKKIPSVPSLAACQDKLIPLKENLHIEATYIFLMNQNTSVSIS